MLDWHEQVQTLSREHSQVESRLFLLTDALDEPDDGDTTWRERTADDILRYMEIHLLHHMKTEEATVFLYAKTLGLNSVVAELVVQHQRLREDLAHLQGNLIDHWQRTKIKGQQFVALLRDHIAQEETSFFPLIDN